MAKREHNLDGKLVVLAVLLLALHALVSVVLGLVIINSAYSFAASFPDGGSVGSPDELYKLGGSPTLGMYGLFVVGLVDFIVVMVLLLYRNSTRPFAFVVPILGIGLSVLVVIAAQNGMHAPAPDLGG